MKFLRNFLDKQKPNFEKGGKWEKYHAVFEAHETLLFTPKTTTKSTGVQVRDAVDMKRFMMTVVIAMIPCLIFGMFNTGYQHYLAMGKGVEFLSLEAFLFGAQKVLPIVAVSYAVGLGIEFVFGTINRHPINEGFLVTGMLIPLVLPATIPLWMLALAVAFAVVLGKEVFGGTGMNIFNVALTARAFLYFAYPTYMSGDVWTYLPQEKAEIVAGYSGATPLSIIAEASNKASASKDLIIEAVQRADRFPSTENSALVAQAKEISATLNSGTSVVDSFAHSGYGDGFYEIYNMFMGFIPGAIGETSVLMCLLGAFLLIFTGVGSWKIIISVFAGAGATGLLMNALHLNEYMAMPAQYHLVIGGLAFGAVFMATDPVTAAQTEKGKWIYGFLIGFFTIMIRVFNGAYPEGIMLAILLMNVFAPLIDYFVVQSNKKRRLKRATV